MWALSHHLQAVIVWDLAAYQPLQTLRGHTHTVGAGALVPGSDKLFTGGFDGEECNIPTYYEYRFFMDTRV
jgi:WD40 repeat protein